MTHTSLNNAMWTINMPVLFVSVVCQMLHLEPGAADVVPALSQLLQVQKLDRWRWHTKSSRFSYFSCSLRLRWLCLLVSLRCCWRKMCSRNQNPGSLARQHSVLNTATTATFTHYDPRLQRAKISPLANSLATVSLARANFKAQVERCRLKTVPDD